MRNVKTLIHQRFRHERICISTARLRVQYNSTTLSQSVATKSKRKTDACLLSSDRYATLKSLSRRFGILRWPAWPCTGNRSVPQSNLGFESLLSSASGRMSDCKTGRMSDCRAQFDVEDGCVPLNQAESFAWHSMIAEGDAEPFSPTHQK